MAEKDISARLRRAVKENNLFLVKRLIQRTDLRNPDPGHRRLTSLAWAAVLGHVETFEFLLNEGHDDEDLSRDMDNNTILLLLADTQRPSPESYACQYENPDIMSATLSMALSYYRRYQQYKFILDWSNVQGKTALHTASLKGNEGLVRMLCDMGADYDLPDNLGNTPLHYASAWNHIQVIQLLIERGCQYNARNHDGFTASDYAYSHSTMHVLQDTAMMQVKSKKGSKRSVKDFDYGGGLNDWIASANTSTTRLRSGSGGSRTTATSDSGDVGYSPMTLSQQSSSFSSPGSQQQPLMSSTSTAGSSSRTQVSQYASPSLNPSSSFTNMSPSPFIPLSSNAALSNSASSINLPNNTSLASHTPAISRVMERDADAIAEYKKRNRSGSAGTQYSTDSKVQQGAVSGNTSGSSGVGSVSTLPTINGSNSHLPLTSNSRNPPPTLATRRLLRPSASAAQLRSSPPLPIVTSQDIHSSGTMSRLRAGTQPTTTRPGVAPVQPQGQTFASPTDSSFSISGRGSVERGSSSRRAGTVPNPSTGSNGGVRRPSDAQGDFTGPPSDYAIFPDPPSKIAVEAATPPPPPSATTKPTGRRTGFALLSKPLPSFDSRLQRDRDHRRGGSASEIRS